MLPSLSFHPVAWTGEAVRFLDQRRLPLEEVYLDARTWPEVAVAIRGITGESAKVKALVDEVNSGGVEQARGTDQIGRAILQMQRVTQTTAASAEPPTPKRTSFPSMLPAVIPLATPACALDSAQPHTSSPATNRTVIVQKITHPSRGRPTMRPKVWVNAAGITTIASSSTKLVNGVGFSNGCAALTLKKPPPFVPRFLMNSIAATGPS